MVGSLAAPSFAALIGVSPGPAPGALPGTLLAALLAALLATGLAALAAMLVGAMIMARADIASFSRRPAFSSSSTPYCSRRR